MTLSGVTYNSFSSDDDGLLPMPLVIIASSCLNTEDVSSLEVSEVREAAGMLMSLS